jgi:hypothetical protein
MPADPTGPSNSDLILYQTEDGNTHIEVHLQDETVWLNQKMMSELFQKDVRTINEHIYNEHELEPHATIRKFRIVQTEGTRNVERQVDFYNLDMIISVGYRVNSHRGTQFRMWATQRLKEYLIKGFVLDDQRLKQSGGGNYFDELLARIRDIRSSEKAFWRKVLDIYATSIDYDARNDISWDFFAIVQNKMHWAAHGNTAAEIIHTRANSDKPNMGLTSWMGDKPRKADTEVAKNYLTTQELDVLNRIVSMYLDFAELQALHLKPMYMKDLIAKLDDFLRISERDILTHAGTISNEAALEKARMEYEKYQKKVINVSSSVEQHFLEAIDETKQIESHRKDQKH